MSAWIVSKDHIDVLVYALLWWNKSPAASYLGAPPELPFDGDPSAIGQMLWHENHLSVNYRYSENDETPLYEYDGSGLDALNVSHFCKAANCYDYQSCEHPAYDNSESRRLVDALSDAIEAQGFGDGHKEYERAPWGFDESHRTAKASTA